MENTLLNLCKIMQKVVKNHKRRNVTDHIVRICSMLFFPFSTQKKSIEQIYECALLDEIKAVTLCSNEKYVYYHVKNTQKRDKTTKDVT